MNGILVESNVILDIFENDANWADWSENQLENLSVDNILFINPVIYSEISIGFARIEELENAINGCGFRMQQIPKEALFLAGKVFLRYRKSKGAKTTPLPDFFIGAHAAVNKLKLLTRDLCHYHSFFPALELISPE